MEERSLSVGAPEYKSVATMAPPGRCVLGPRRSAHRGASTTFVATTEWVDGGVPVISVMGELDLATAPALEEALLALPAGGGGTVIVDLASCGFIDLRGLHVLLAARERFASLGRPLSLVVRNTSLLRVFTITRVEHLFAIHPSVTAALGSDGRG